MPVPRRFDRRLPERDSTRINDRIRVPEVRVIGDDGNQIGVLRTEEALRLAQERDLDLVEVAPDSRPPVCRILDYSKYKYEQAQKVKAARKHQQQVTIREIKFRPKIGQHDYETKKGHVERFLRQRNKVKITIMFRGREVTHPELGKKILDRLAEELEAYGTIEQRPNLDGRNMTMLLGPSRDVLAGKIGSRDEDEQETVAPVAPDSTAGKLESEQPVAPAEPEGAGEMPPVQEPADEPLVDSGEAPTAAAEGTGKASEGEDADAAEADADAAASSKPAASKKAAASSKS